MRVSTIRRQWRAIQVVLYIAVGALLARSLFVLAERSWWVLTCPYEIDYGEGTVLLNAVNLARGGEVYTDYRHYPYLAATYPPVYPLLGAVGVKMFGVSFAFGRALSCLAALGVTALIWAMLRRMGTSRSAAAWGAGLFLVSPIVLCFAPLMRVDMIAVVFGMAGLYCVVRGGRWLIPAVALMVLSIYTRQSSMAPLAASVVYLWWIRERRNAALVAVSSAAVALAVFAMLQLASHGWFYRHVVVANQNRWEFPILALLWRAALLGWPLPFLMALVGVGYAAAARTTGPQRCQGEACRKPMRLLGPYLGFALLVSLTAGKIGANVNYLLESLAASCLVAGIGFQWLLEHQRSPMARVAWVAMWLVLVGSLIPALVKPKERTYLSAQRWRSKIMEGGKEAVALIRKTKGDVLSDNVGLLVIAGRPVLLDPHKMTSMYRDGNWNQRPLVEDIKRRRFALIILTWDPFEAALDQWATYGHLRWSIGMGNAIIRNYYVVKQAGALYITAPADAKHPACAEARRQPRPQPEADVPSAEPD